MEIWKDEICKFGKLKFGKIEIWNNGNSEY